MTPATMTQVRSVVPEDFRSNNSIRGGSKFSTFSRVYKAHARGRGLMLFKCFLNPMKMMMSPHIEHLVFVAEYQLNNVTLPS